MDYEVLRTEGLSYIEQFASDIWTDFNPHDPGITIKENLCYAITDLGFRTNYPIQDILHDKAQPLSEQFFTADKILPCNPLTINDYRKLLIDIDGIENAWLLKAETAEIDIFANCKSSEIQLTPPTDGDQVMLNGLYRVLLAPSPDTDLSHESLIQKATETLMAHRNLCEDFFCIEIIPRQQLGVCAEIEVENGANLNAVEAMILYKFFEHLHPKIPFYSLSELYEKGKTSDEIFDGPLLHHGFIDTEDLEKNKLLKTVNSSDLYKLIMEVEGVIAVRFLSMFLYSNDDPPVAISTEGESWQLEIPEGVQVVLNPEVCQLTYIKDKVLRYGSSPAAVKDKLALLQTQARISRYPLEPLDVPLPQGRSRNIKAFNSVQQEFPATYGLAPNGLPSSASIERKAQQKQLQAYLTFFDQLLANYLGQLNHTKHLLSVCQNADSSYVNEVLSDNPGLPDLLVGYTGTTTAEWEAHISNPVTVQGFQDIMATDAVHKDRISRSLDHLLARFSESFNEYALLMFRLSSDLEGGDAKTIEEMIDDKRKFLKEYPAISQTRGQAFNYQLKEEGACANFKSTNISGLERRVARFTGIDMEAWESSVFGADKYFLIYPIKLKNGNLRYRYALMDEDGELILDSAKQYAQIQNARIAMKEFMSYMYDVDNYRVVNNNIQLFKISSANKVIILGYSFSKSFNIKGNRTIGEIVTYLGAADCPIRQMLIQSVPNVKNHLRIALLPSDIKEEDPILYYKQNSFSILNSARKRVHELYMEMYTVTVDNITDYTVVSGTKEELVDSVKEQFFPEVCGSEKFYLIEHLLLRPKHSDYYKFLPISIDCAECACCNAIRDPYTFRLTVVLPYWVGRFSNMTFRYYFEKILRTECPSHIVPKICWVNAEQLSQYEEAYKIWLDLMCDESFCQIPADHIGAPTPLSIATDNLIEVLNNLNSVYPTAQFHDCEDDESGGGIILGNTILGQ